MSVVLTGLELLQMLVWLVAYGVVMAVGARLARDAPRQGLSLVAAAVLGAVVLVLGAVTNYGVVRAVGEGHIPIEAFEPLMAGIHLSRTLAGIVIWLLLMFGVFSGRGGHGLAATLPAAPPRLP